MESFVFICWEPTYKFFEDYLTTLSDDTPLLIIKNVEDINEDLKPIFEDKIGICVQTNLIQNPKIFKYACVLNTEQLTRVSMMHFLYQMIRDFNTNTFVDYSPINSTLFRETFPTKTIETIPYQHNTKEIERLQGFLNVTKTHDVAVISNIGERRQKITEKLRSEGITVLEINEEWKENRDKKVGQCKVLLNVHYADDYNVYEHIRCDRWIFAGMPVVSERSKYQKLLDIYPHVTFAKYDDITNAVKNTLQTLNTFKPDFEAFQRIGDKRKEMMYNTLSSLKECAK